MNNNEISLREKQLDCNELIARNRENGWPDIEPQHKGFALKYVEQYSIKDAASAVGIGVAKAKELLRQPLVMAYLNDIQDTLAQRSIINRDFINIQWLKLLPKVMGEEEIPIVDVKNGIAFSAKEFNANAAAKVLTELSKSTNFYADGSGGTASVTVNIDLSALGINSPTEKVIGNG